MSSDDITRHYHGGEPHSVEAHETTPAKVRAVQRARVYAYISACGSVGCTCDEAEAALGMSHQTCSARFTDLKRDGLIIKTDRSRVTRQGKPAAVCVAVRWGVAGYAPPIDDLFGDVA